MPDPKRRSVSPVAALKALFNPRKHLGRSFWIRFVAACLLVLIIESVFDYLVEDEDQELPQVTQSVFNAAGLYQGIVAAPRDPIPRYTTVVEINPALDSTAIDLHHICEQRKMMTTLLNIMKDGLPKVIVLDKYYSSALFPPCGKDVDTGLISAVQDLRTHHIPVIVGRRIQESSEAEGSNSKDYLVPSLPLGDTSACRDKVQAGRLCFEGIVNIDRDTRKLPLEWPVFESKDDIANGQARLHPTLALSAAYAYDNDLIARHPRLARFVRAAEHPYISFLSKNNIHPILTSAFLASNDSHDPAVMDELAVKLGEVRGKVVLIGEINDDADSHPTVVGRMPGLYVQANYIEALLDDRYYRPLPVLDYILGFILLAAVEFILVVYGGRYWLAIPLIGTVLLIGVAILYVIVVHFRCYVDPVPVGGTALVIKILHLPFAGVEEAAEAVS